MHKVPTINPESYGIEAYMTANLADIEAAMTSMAKQRYEEAKMDDLPEDHQDMPLFDLSRRMLSEMEICDFPFLLAPTVGYPQGYSFFTRGYIETASFAKPVPHMYLQSANDIICFTPGQFILPNDLQLGRGDRMRILQDRAMRSGHPELITQFSDDVWMLHGNRHVIMRSLKLNYN